MKLSEIKGERVLDVIAELIGPITRIAQDKNVSGAIKAADGDQTKAVSDIAPLILKEHREDVIGILSTVNGVTREEYAENMTMASAIKDLFDVLTDKELLAFFE